MTHVKTSRSRRDSCRINLQPLKAIEDYWTLYEYR